MFHRRANLEVYVWVHLMIQSTFILMTRPSRMVSTLFHPSSCILKILNMHTKPLACIFLSLLTPGKSVGPSGHQDRFYSAEVTLWPLQPFVGQQLARGQKPTSLLILYPLVQEMKVTTTKPEIGVNSNRMEWLFGARATP